MSLTLALTSLEALSLLETATAVYDPPCDHIFCIVVLIAPFRLQAQLKIGVSLLSVGGFLPLEHATFLCCRVYLIYEGRPELEFII